MRRFAAALLASAGVAAAFAQTPQPSAPPSVGPSGAAQSAAAKAPAAGGKTAQLLYQGKTAEAAAALGERLRAEPTDDQARMELGFVQFVQASERYLQFLHRKGVLFDAVPPFNMPIRLWNSTEEERAGFEAVKYEEFDAALAKLVEDLGVAEKTLAAIRSRDVAFTVDLAKVAVDADGNGRIEEKERIVQLWGRPIGGGGLPEALETRFDYADVLWLRGYCNAGSAMTSWILAHDFRAMFETSGVLFFAKVEPLRRPARKGGDRMTTSIMDAIAAIHLCRGKVKAPQRRQAAWEHCKEVVRLGRETRAAVLAETDDDHEWLPSAKQHGVLGLPIDAAMVDAWGNALEEMDRVLDGKRLLPHPLVDLQYGVNLKKLLLDSDEFDLVMWVHGEGMRHALEEGPTTDMRTWAEVERAFGSGWPMYSIFINALRYEPTFGENAAGADRR